jgi:2'-5' RNA ligase
VGRYFATFEEAWSFFLTREEPLEEFFGRLPDHESYILCWLLPFERSLVPRIQTAQRSFAALEWIDPQPEHFLHTSIAAVAVSPRRPTADEITAAAEAARRAWSGVQPFDVHYRRVNCFHDAVVVEVSGDGPKTLVERLVDEGAVDTVDPEVFLPHVTIGAFNERADASALRHALTQIRDLDVGRQRVGEATLCLVPASRSTILSPWEIVGRVQFA